MLSLLANAIYKTSELVVTMCFILLTNDLSRWLIKQYKHFNRFNGLFSYNNVYPNHNRKNK